MRSRKSQETSTFGMIAMRALTVFKAHGMIDALAEVNISLIQVSCSNIARASLQSLHKTNCVERNTTMQYIHGVVCIDKNSTTTGSRVVHTEPWCAGACNTHIHPIEKRGSLWKKE